jgi:hypothetical protein
VLLVAAFAAGSGATLALPSDAPAAPPPVPSATPQASPEALALWLARGAMLAGQLALESVAPTWGSPAVRTPGLIDGGERLDDPMPIPEWWTGGDDPSGPWPAA